MVIDYAITIGNPVEIASILGGGLMVTITLRSDVANIKAEVGGIQIEIKKINDVLITQADQNRRIPQLEEDFASCATATDSSRLAVRPASIASRMMSFTIAIIAAVMFMLGRRMDQPVQDTKRIPGRRRHRRHWCALTISALIAHRVP